MIGKRETSCRLIKNNKQLINNYCPVSVTVIYKQSNSCQSGFRPNDSRINELILITHNINRAFDGNLSLEVPGVFQKHLTRSGVKFKLKNNRINGNALQSVDSLKGRFEWTVFQLAVNKSWRIASSSIGTTVFSYLYKRSTRSAKL